MYQTGIRHAKQTGNASVVMVNNTVTAEVVLMQMIPVQSSLRV
jgi:hypothetical protein